MAIFSFSRHSESERIVGQRCYLRPQHGSDHAEWTALRMASRSFLEKWEPSWSPDEFSLLAFRQRVKIHEKRASADEGYAFFICEKNTHRLMGGLTLSHVRRGVSQSATIGYWMGEAYAGQGYMKDALMALISTSHARFGFHRLEAACLPHNERSRRLLLSCGFEQEGYAKAYVKIAGRWEDHILFGRVVD